MDIEIKVSKLNIWKINYCVVVDSTAAPDNLCQVLMDCLNIQAIKG